MKNFDANGTDVDAYPERAFQGGVYQGGILGGYRSKVRTTPEAYTRLIITEINARNRERVSRAENLAHRQLEDEHRAVRLRQDRAQALSLERVRIDAHLRGALGETELRRDALRNNVTMSQLGVSYEQLEEMLAGFAYLANVPEEAFYK